MDIPFKNKFVDKDIYDELDEKDKKTTFLVNKDYKTVEFKDKYKYADRFELEEHEVVE